MEVNFFYTTARGYLHAVQLTADHNQHNDSGYLAAPIYMLIGFVVELMLKAWLLNAGLNDKQLKDIGHDLQKLYAVACENGFASAQPVNQIVDGMAEAHRTHAFRYMKSGDLTLPVIDDMIPYLVAWDDEIRATLGYD